MRLMLQQNAPEDFVVASGESHTVREFCELAFAEVDLDYRSYVRVDEQFLRPAEVGTLIGDASKARSVLGWEPTCTFPELVREMVQNDLKLVLGQTAEPSTANAGARVPVLEAGGNTD
jgi:GDPmannose 4,6-dehydratase